MLCKNCAHQIKLTVTQRAYIHVYDIHTCVHHTQTYLFTQIKLMPPMVY